MIRQLGKDGWPSDDVVIANRDREIAIYKEYYEADLVYNDLLAGDTTEYSFDPTDRLYAARLEVKKLRGDK